MQFFPNVPLANVLSMVVICHDYSSSEKSVSSDSSLILFIMCMVIAMNLKWSFKIRESFCSNWTKIP